ncbi:hypothetical protein LCGC14_2382030 [marine sediment metagenome]|uniref:Uncharacterized protein n=1 Tax=marine sediment metagenome TaxID=412755 RepID=A0A0F9C0S5_9ZZZZ
MPQSKEVHKEYMKKRRAVEKGVNEVGITRIEFIQRELNDDDLIKGIDAAAVRFKDREARYERAYRYNQWRKGKEVAPAIAYALTYDREKTEEITQSLKDFNVSKRSDTESTALRLT